MESVRQFTFATRMATAWSFTGIHRELAAQG